MDSMMQRPVPNQMYNQPGGYMGQNQMYMQPTMTSVGSAPNLASQFDALNLGNIPIPQMGKRLSKEEKNQTPSLYVDNLPDNFFDLDLYKFFTSKGFQPKTAKVVLDKKTSKSKGYGYL